MLINRGLMSRTTSLILLSVGIAALASTGCGGGSSAAADATTLKSDTARQSNGKPGPRPNIIFILVDTMRADRLGAYGGPQGLTPFMDKVAAEGVVLNRAIAPAPWTLPSVGSLFTGVYPDVHRANDYDIALKGGQPNAVSVAVLAPSFTTIAERLHDSGYETAGFVANVFLKPSFGLNQGFDHYDDSFAANTTPGKLINEAAVRWLRARKSDKPLFLYLHYMDVHAPYTDDDRFVEPLVKRVAEGSEKTKIARQEMNNHPGYFGKSAKPYLNNDMHKALFEYREYWWARYDAGVRQVDNYVGELQTQLDALGLWSNAYVIITADHGEALGEHGVWTHGLTANQDQLHVPLILRWPGKLTAGQRVGQSVSLMDLRATILDQLGLAAGKGAQCTSFKGLLDGTSSEPHVALAEAVKYKPHEFALVQGKWKLLVDRDAKMVQLFDLDADPNEHHDVSAQHADVVKQLMAMLDQRLEQNAQRAAGTGGDHRAATPDEIKRLQGLGYVGGEQEKDDDGGG